MNINMNRIIAATAIASTLLLARCALGGGVVNTNNWEVRAAYPTRIGGTYNPSIEMLRDAGWREFIDCPNIENSNATSRAYSDDGETVTASCQYEVAPIIPTYAGREFEWIMLDDHPATNDIPAGGMTYRLSGDPITWWVVRQGDLEATQISAHDDAGQPIYRSRNLGTGNERTIHVGALEAAARVTVKATVTNATALIELADIFRFWTAGVSVTSGDLLRWDGDLYRVIQAHTTQSDWAPPNVPALFVKIAAPGSAPQPWVQPYGGSGTYTNGSIVTYNGQTWVNTHPAPNLNVWIPGQFGWEPQ
jgi:hypothetical protein